MSTEGRRSGLFTVNYIFAIKQIRLKDTILSAAILELKRAIGGWTLNYARRCPQFEIYTSVSREAAVVPIHPNHALIPKWYSVNGVYSASKIVSTVFP